MINSLSGKFSFLNKNLIILTCCFAVFMSVSVFVIFLGGIIGSSLTTNDSLSTLPIALFILGTALNILVVNNFIGIFGRKLVFIVMGFYAIIVTLLAILAIWQKSFILFNFVFFLFGAIAATMNQFRFAAVASVNKKYSTNAISTILIGGLFAAFITPEIAIFGKNLLSIDFAGSLLFIAILFVFAIILLYFFTDTTIQIEQKNDKQTLLDILKQPTVIVAISCGFTGYVVMSYIMTATPMSMHTIEEFSLEQTKTVIQSHIFAMFIPSLFTAIIVRFMGLYKTLIIGVLIYMLAIVIALVGREYVNYLFSLFLVGIGWNFLFIGGTALLSKIQNVNKIKTQTINDFIIFTAQGVASLSAGFVVFTFGWHNILISTVPVILLQLFIVLYFKNKVSTYTIYKK